MLLTPDELASCLDEPRIRSRIHSIHTFTSSRPGIFLVLIRFSTAALRASDADFF